MNYFRNKSNYLPIFLMLFNFRGFCYCLFVLRHLLALWLRLTANLLFPASVFIILIPFKKDFIVFMYICIYICVYMCKHLWQLEESIGFLCSQKRVLDSCAARVIGSYDLSAAGAGNRTLVT